MAGVKVRHEPLRPEARMRVNEALNLPSLGTARQLGPGDLSRVVGVAHVVDVPDTARWVTPGTFLLSTGLS